MKLTPRHDRAALQLAERQMTWLQIAAEAGVSDVALYKWTKDADFAALVDEHRATLHAAIVRDGITAKQTRVAGMQERHRRMWAVIEARAADPKNQDIAGGTTGLLVRQVKPAPGSRVGMTEEWAVDTGLLSEMRATEKQVAQELGEWTEKRELSGKDGAPLRIDLTGLSDDELATLHALRHKLAAQPGGD
jgi:hypothetical protein